MGIHQIRRKPEPEQIPETGFYSYPQASKYLRLPVARLRILQRSGKLNRIPGTHAHLFAKEELDRFRRQAETNGNGTKPVAEAFEERFEERFSEIQQLSNEATAARVKNDTDAIERLREKAKGYGLDAASIRSLIGE